MKKEPTHQLQNSGFPLVDFWLAMKINITTQTFLEFADINGLIIIAICIAIFMCVYIIEAPKPAELEVDQSHIPN